MIFVTSVHSLGLVWQPTSMPDSKPSPRGGRLRRNLPCGISPGHLEASCGGFQPNRVQFPCGNAPSLPGLGRNPPLAPKAPTRWLAVPNSMLTLFSPSPLHAPPLWSPLLSHQLSSPPLMSSCYATVSFFRSSPHLTPFLVDLGRKSFCHEWMTT